MNVLVTLHTGVQDVWVFACSRWALFLLYHPLDIVQHRLHVVSHYFSVSEYPESCAQTKVIILNHPSSRKCVDYCSTSTIRQHGRTLQQDTCNTVGLVVDSMVSRHLGEVLVYGGDLNNMEMATRDRWPWRRGQCDNTSPVRLVCLPFGQKMTPDLSRTRSLALWLISARNSSLLPFVIKLICLPALFSVHRIKSALIFVQFSTFYALLLFHCCYFLRDWVTNRRSH